MFNSKIQTFFAKHRINIGLALNTYSVSLAVLPVVIVVMIAINMFGQQARDQAVNQMNSIAEAKIQEIQRWLKNSEITLDLVLTNPEQYRRMSEILLSGGRTGPKGANVTSFLQSQLVLQNSFEELYIYNTDGEIRVSTSEEQVGVNVKEQKQPYFETSLKNRYIQPPYYDDAKGAINGIVLQPIYHINGEVIGVMAGRLNINTLADIVTSRVGLNKTAETYLISAENNNFVTPSHFEKYNPTSSYHSFGIEAALKGVNGEDFYRSYRDKEVIGVYRWIPELKSGMLAEIEQAEALKAVYDVQNLSIITAAIAAIIALIIGRGITIWIIGLYAVAEQELTERKRAEAALQVANQELTKMNADKDKFFSIVAHDLKGPFQPLLGLSHLLTEMADKVSPKDVHEMSESIYRSAKNVYNLLENLLQWSRLQRGRMEFQSTALDLPRMAEQTINLLTENAAAKGVILQSQVPNGLFGRGDEYMIDTVIRNLTSNALKFTPHGGVVTIAAQADGLSAENFVEVVVSDTGVGISEENIQKLFKMEVHHSTLGTAKEQGTGLGLIICQEMVEKNGGRIWIESELGKGTAVKFTVPFDKFIPETKVGNLGTEAKDLRLEAHQTATIPSETPSFIVPSPTEMAVLFDLAMRGDMEGIQSWGSRMAQQNEQFIPFTAKLEELARGFEEEEILALVEQFYGEK